MELQFCTATNLLYNSELQFSYKHNGEMIEKVEEAWRISR